MSLGMDLKFVGDCIKCHVRRLFTGTVIRTELPLRSGLMPGAIEREGQAGCGCRKKILSRRDIAHLEAAGATGVLGKNHPVGVPACYHRYLYLGFWSHIPL
jgi:hypothetical protein